MIKEGENIYIGNSAGRDTNDGDNLWLWQSGKEQ
jgi:hypothetical protein